MFTSGFGFISSRTFSGFGVNPKLEVIPKLGGLKRSSTRRLDACAAGTPWGWQSPRWSYTPPPRAHALGAPYEASAPHMQLQKTYNISCLTHERREIDGLRRPVDPATARDELFHVDETSTDFVPSSKALQRLVRRCRAAGTDLGRRLQTCQGATHFRVPRHPRTLAIFARGGLQGRQGKLQDGVPNTQVEVVTAAANCTECHLNRHTKTPLLAHVL